MSLWRDFEPLWWAIIVISIIISILLLYCIIDISSRYCCSKQKKQANDVETIKTQFQQIRESRDQTPQKNSHQRIEFNSELRRVVENKPNLKPFVQASCHQPCRYPVPDLEELETNRYIASKYS